MDKYFIDLKNIYGILNRDIVCYIKRYKLYVYFIHIIMLMKT